MTVFKAKLTVQRGKPELRQIIVTPGAAEAQSDTMSLNIDATHITKGDALMMICELEEKIQASKWPLL
jgi:hypothetical protein